MNDLNRLRQLAGIQLNEDNKPLNTYKITFKKKGQSDRWSYEKAPTSAAALKQHLDVTSTYKWWPTAEIETVVIELANGVELEDDDEKDFK